MNDAPHTIEEFEELEMDRVYMLDRHHIVAELTDYYDLDAEDMVSLETGKLKDLLVDVSVSKYAANVFNKEWHR